LLTVVSLQPYRQLLRVPGLPTLMLVMFFARLPITAMAITLTLHVVGDLGRGYGAAGLVGTATMVGSALGAPVIGRMIDRYGLRPVIAVCGLVSSAYWLSSPHLPYLVLLLVALPAGLLTVPVGSITRQVIAALVPQGQRRTAYSMDTVAVEATFMIGPATGIFVTTQWSSTVALTVIGCCFLLLTAALYRMNPPVRNADELAAAHRSRPPLTDWVSNRLVATLLIATGALFVLAGMELATLAALRATGDVGWTGPVIAIMCVASLVGGLVYGGARRSLSQLSLMVGLAVLTIPVGLLDHPWWLLAVVLIPANLLCAPTLAATTEAVSALAPVRVRGEAMGLQDSATRLGMAIGSPVVGFVLDHATPVWGFAASGLGGLVFAGAGLLLGRRAVTGAPALAAH
jgi:MFS family permease